MQNRIVPIALVVAVLAAGAYAVFRPEPAAAPVAPDDAQSAGPLPLGAQAFDDPHADPHAGESLPPDHPPIDSMGPGNSAGAAPREADADLTWKMPAAWKEAPNPNTMRLATYKVPHAPSDTEDAEVSISQAGGATDANIARWVGQFKDAGKEQRTTKTVHGLTVTTVAVEGTYLGGGMMMGGGSAPKTNWMLVGAIVETPGAPYFFKMTGPAATVRAARSAFDGMMDGIAKKP